MSGGNFPRWVIVLIVIVVNLWLCYSSNSPPTVRWLEDHNFRLRSDVVKKNSLTISHFDRMVKEYSKVKELNPGVHGVGTLFSKSITRLDSSQEPDFKLISSFMRGHTADHLIGDTDRKDCGVINKGSHLSILNCPGTLYILSLTKSGVVSCSNLDKLKLYGPVIIKSENCSQSILMQRDCDVAEELFYTSDFCIPRVKPVHNALMITAIVIITLVTFVMMISSLRFISKIISVKKEFKRNISSKGLTLTGYKIHDHERGELISQVRIPRVPNQTEIKKTYSWITIMLMILCFKTLEVDSYDVSRIFNDKSDIWKYEITMGSGESIRVGNHEIKLSQSDHIAGIYHMFETYEWNLETYNSYSCLRKDCAAVIDCREDLLPFNELDGPGKRFLKVNESYNVYGTCVNKRAYCQFSNGCFVIGFSIKQKSDVIYQVYKVRSQGKEEEEVALPPGCFMDTISRPSSVNLHGLFFLKGSNGDSYLCPSELYSHYPMPHSLGDLKIGINNNINFISDHINCATDTWEDVKCVFPN